MGFAYLVPGILRDHLPHLIAQLLPLQNKIAGLVPGHDAGSGSGALPLFVALPRPVVPGRCGRPTGDVMDSELEQKNLVLGLWLFGFFLVLLALTAIVAVVVVYG